MSANALEDFRNLKASRERRAVPKQPTIITWRATLDLGTGESHYEYDEALVAAAMKAPDDYVISEVGAVTLTGKAPRDAWKSSRFITPKPSEPGDPEPSFGELLAPHLA